VFCFWDRVSLLRLAFLFIYLFIWVFFLQYWGLNSGPKPQVTPPALFFFNLFSNFIFHLSLLLFIYSHVHTLFGSFLHPAPLPRSVPGRSHSVLITDFVEETT
jgi:hypothetical protein